MPMLMKKVLIILMLLAININLAADNHVVIIGNRHSSVKALASNQIQDIYMGRKRAFPDGKMALPIDQATLRPFFYEKMAHRPIEQIDAYWARIIFSGQSAPPLVLPDDNAVIKAVSENEGAIGYIKKANVNKKVHVLFILN
jgi:hypothetical protein